MNDNKQVNVRKKPSQKRSKETVLAILEAAALVLAEKGYAQTTTDRIAEKAGISIGSLYQYFPNKDAIIFAIVERHLEQMNIFIEDMIKAIQAMGVITREMTRNFALLMLEHHDQEPELHRVLYEESPQPQPVRAAIARAEEKAAKGLVEILGKSSSGKIKNPELALRVAVRTIEALTHWYALDARRDIPREDFIDELSDMINGYLKIKN